MQLQAKINFRIVIPARYESSRFPGKPLVEIAGKPMIQHVYERSLQSGAMSVVIATDDQRIFDAAEKFGAKVCMTAIEHYSGTDRIAEAVERLNYNDDEIIVDVQGDEPMIPIANIAQVATDLAVHLHADVSTLYEPIIIPEQIFAANIAKVVFDHAGNALFFSRAPMPFDRDNFVNVQKSLLAKCYYKHVGMYAYRVGFLRKFSKWQPCEYEKLEKLEQLRMLWNGAKVHLVQAQESGACGVDTPEDLAKIKALF